METITILEGQPQLVLQNPSVACYPDTQYPVILAQVKTRTNNAKELIDKTKSGAKLVYRNPATFGEVDFRIHSIKTESTEDGDVATIWVLYEV